MRPRLSKRLKRLQVVATAFVLAAAACAGPGPEGDTVTVLASWTGSEQTAFEAVLAAFTSETGIEVTYQGTRALNQVLAADVQNGNPPDIAVMPNAGELARYARRGDLTPLDDVVGEDHALAYSDQWRQLQRVGGNELRSIVVKADLKSLIWYNTARLTGPAPQTWDELMAYGDGFRQRGETPWCMGMGAPPTSGWPGTDWIEDILLHQSGTDTYRKWASGTLAWTSPQVRQAWATWASIVGTPGSVRGGSSAALLTDFVDAGRPMFSTPAGCSLEHQGSFIMGVYQGYDQEPVPEEDFDFFPFPRFVAAGQDAPVSVVSADLAGMFNDTPQARELIRFLAESDGQRIWPARGGAFSANRRVVEDLYLDRDVPEGDPVRRIAETLTDGTPLCFDASDLMPAAMSSAFHRAVLEFLADQSRLDTLLDQLDEVRENIDRGEWLSFSCGQ